MRSSATVVIVGAGVVGASVAWHLTGRGVRDIVIVDRASGPGFGSTGAATGGFRAQFSNAINVRLSLLARAALRRFRDEVGTDPGYDPVGYLWLAGSEVELDALRAARRVQHEEGLIEAIEVDPGDIASLHPAIRRDAILAGAFCPTDGYLRPLSILEGYLTSALRAGARAIYDEEVTGVVRGDGDRIAAVRTARRTIPCATVVNAAGAWAGELARLAEVDLPVAPLRRQVAMTAPTGAIPPDAPMTIWCQDGFHVRPRDGRVLLAFPTPGVEDDPWSVRVETAWLTEVERRKNDRVPALCDVPLDPAAGWAGLYEMSPDKHAILGMAPGCSNLLLVNGSSGHGVMHAPALGRLAAELIVDGRATSLDVGSLRPERFAEGDPNPPELL